LEIIYFTDETIDRFIKEDVPYLDLTTQLLDFAGKKGKMEFICREEAVVCGTEEVLRIFNKLNITSGQYVSSGAKVQPQTTVIEGVGSAGDLHMAWKVSMNILEYTSGIATRTSNILVKARQVNPNIEILSTRKIFPGTKELSVKAVIAGGGLPHRLGISETVLIFKQHLNFIGGLGGLLTKLGEIRRKSCEKKIIVEVETVEEALVLSASGVDGLQFDKMPPAELQKAVEQVRTQNNNIVLLAAGGINEINAGHYAQTGVDGLVLTSVYFGKPVDMGTKIEPLSDG
jgi:molybdenum transport protein